MIAAMVIGSGLIWLPMLFYFLAVLAHGGVVTDGPPAGSIRDLVTKAMEAMFDAVNIVTALPCPGLRWINGMFWGWVLTTAVFRCGWRWHLIGAILIIALGWVTIPTSAVLKKSQADQLGRPLIAELQRRSLIRDLQS